MAKYWQKRPEFEAVQLIPANTEAINAITQGDVGFSDRICYMYRNGEVVTEPIGTWMVRNPQSRAGLAFVDPQQFRQEYETVPEVVIEPQAIDPMPRRGEE